MASLSSARSVASVYGHHDHHVGGHLGGGTNSAVTDGKRRSRQQDDPAAKKVGATAPMIWLARSKAGNRRVRYTKRTTSPTSVPAARPAA